PSSRSMWAVVSRTASSSSTSRIAASLASRLCDRNAWRCVAEAADWARGRKMQTLVPTPTSVSILTPPPDCLHSPSTWLRPRPEPRPTSLVVKNGSNARASTASSMPLPLSRTQSITYSPGSGSSGRVRGWPIVTFSVSSEMSPPASIASRALIARLRMIISIWVGSTSAGQGSERSRVSSVTAPPSVLRKRSSSERMASLRSTGFGSSFWRREKASSWRVSLAPRSAAMRIMARRRRSSAAALFSSRARLPSTTGSRLLKSCATPAVSWPTASRRCMCIIVASTRSRSAISASSWRLAAASSAVRSCTRRSSWSARPRKRSSLSRSDWAVRSCSSSIASASRWRRRVRTTERAALTRLIGCSGRSSTVTLPSRSMEAWVCGRTGASRLRNRMIGKSDQGGWVSRKARSGCGSSRSNASSATTRPAASPKPTRRSSKLAMVSASRPAALTMPAMTFASRPTGASTRIGPAASSVGIRPRLEKRGSRAGEGGNAGQHALELRQHRTHAQALAVDKELPDRRFVSSGALLHHRKRAADAPARLEEAQQQHRVGEVGEVDRGLHGADQAVLGEDHDGHHALLAEIAQQLVHLQGEVGLLRHGVLVAGERVQHDDAGAGFDSVADHGRQFAGRELGGVHVLQAEQAGALVLRQVDAHAAAALQQHAARLVERHHQRLLATVHGGGQELQRQRGLAGAGRPDDERAGAAVEPAAQQTIEL